MICYFCQTPHKPDPSRPKREDDDFQAYKECENCFNLYGVKCHTFNGLVEKEDGSYHLKDDGLLLYAHIYIDETTVITVPGPASFPWCRSHLVFGHNYHIRLHLRENYTQISDPTDSDPRELFKVPGFPIKAENAKNKLRLYLLLA